VASRNSKKTASTSRARVPREPESANVLRRFIEAVESGELLDPTPQDDAVVRHLQGKLTALQDEATAGAPVLSGRR
jgi:hypothetical protein